nr:hypothetical protein [Acidobacteriota bacterium]
MTNTTEQTQAHAPARAAHPPRAPLHEDEPRTLVEVFERALARHARPDTLNAKRGGAWQPVSSEDFLRRARHVALGLYSLGVRRG